MNSRREIATVALFAVVVGIVIALFVYIAITKDDAHFLNRGGATILVLTALFVVLQITREMALDTRLDRLHEAGKVQAPMRTLSEPSVVGRMKKKTLSRGRADVREVRMIYVWLVAIMTALGEFLHGWGDLVLIALGLVSHH